MITHRIRGGLGALLILVAFGVGTALPASALARHRPRHVVHHKVVHHSSGIPQHGGGDGDSDNFGAPSDGDGNL